jgi:hypothetical protein
MCYELLIELPAVPGVQPRLGDAVDAALGQINAEYYSKRASGRLGPLLVTMLRPGSADEYKATELRRGMREAQFKPKLLQYRRDLHWQPAEQGASS